jgi:uncharacterized protein (DUF4213/DUF364 family)
MERGARELARLADSDSVIEAAIGLATINALLPVDEGRPAERNAEEVILHHGVGRRVALIGHFPFVDRVRERVGQLWVLERRPRPGDLPASEVIEVVPRADLVAVTATTLLNRTFEEVMALRRPDALVLVLGPSTPLSPILLDHGAHILSGSVVEDIDAVLRTVGQGANFRQIHRVGVRLVTMQRDGWPAEEVP